MNILVFNPGSATLKFGLYRIPAPGQADASAELAQVLASGQIEPIGAPQSTLTLELAAQQTISETVQAQTPAQAVEHVIHRLLGSAGGNAAGALAIDAVGVRVVHGGPKFVAPVRVTPSVLDEIRALAGLAPLHNPVDVAMLEQVMHSLPRTALVAVFDTAFHRTMPPVAYSYALPFELSARHDLRRYGFHGISYAHVSRQLFGRLGRGPTGTKVVLCHLGNGASVCALRDGQSVDTSMGFTPLEGLVMGTRSGDVDPGLVLYLVRTLGMAASDVERLLNRESGLRGLSGLSADVRELEQAELKGDKHAAQALDVFAYRVRKYIGAYAAALEGLDALAFTGGIGQHSAVMRSRICAGLAFLGIRLDDARNKAVDGRTAARIDAEGSPAPIWVIPADEEREIARSTDELLRDYDLRQVPALDHI